MRRRRRVAVVLVLAVLLLGVGGSVAVTATLWGLQRHHAAELMDRYADDTSRAVATEANRYTDAIADLGVSIGAQSNFTAGDFSTITSRLTRRQLPGAVGVAFAVAADDNQIGRVQAYWRARGAAGLRLAPVGTGHEHVFPIFNRTLDANPSVAGRDLSAAAEPLDALQTSRTSGQTTASRTYILLKDRSIPAGQQQLSFVFTTPVYGGTGTPDDGQFRGWIVMGMRGDDFIDETLRTQARDAVNVTLADDSTGVPRIVADTTDHRLLGGSMSRTRTITVGQRTWQLRIYPTGALLSTTDRRLAALACGIGLLITLLLGVLVGTLTTARNRALARVEQATVALRQDIERRKAIEIRLRERDHELQHLAFHDPLTGVANRTLFYERLEHAIALHRRSPNTLAVLFIDLDGFKKVNDDLGHSAGDTVLIQFATRLQQCVHASDTVARFGGDEFAVLTENLSHPDQAESIADRIVGTLDTPFDIDGQPATISASIGIAHQHDNTSPDDMLRIADEAMYIVKTTGKGRYTTALKLTP